MRPSRLLLAALCLDASLLAAQTDYPLTADSSRQDGVPKGTLSQHSWTSTIFPGTVRDYWVYVPAQYQAGTPAAVMVFQDGAAYVSEEGRWRIPTVFDNLIHKGEMPVTIGIFVNPGVLPAASPEAQGRFNRSYEYDGLSDRYARFLIEEILPEVGKTHELTADPNLRAIGGSSSGGIASFTAAWLRPDAFRRVLSFIGSYTNLRGGHSYSSLVRKTEPKPIRVFLQDGSRDLNLYAGNWWIANQDLASALEYAGYDARFVAGDQGHNGIHGSAILPDALRWLFRDWKQPIAPSPGLPTAERHFVTQILEPGRGWELVSGGHQKTAAAAVDKSGNVYFAGTAGNRIHRIEHATSRITVFKEGAGGVRGMMFGPDGRLYASQTARKEVVAYDTAGRETVVASGVEASDLAVSASGDVWFTEPARKRVWHVSAKGVKRVVHEGLAHPSGLRLSLDQTLLAVADAESRFAWSFQVASDGSLRHGEPFYHLESSDESSVSGAGGMTYDSEGYLYMVTGLGLQVLDQTGRVTAIIDAPEGNVPSSLAFGGPNLDRLYATAGGKLYGRPLRRRGVHPWQAAKPPQPRL